MEGDQVVAQGLWEYSVWNRSLWDSTVQAPGRLKRTEAILLGYWACHLSLVVMVVITIFSSIHRSQIPLPSMLCRQVLALCLKPEVGSKRNELEAAW